MDHHQRVPGTVGWVDLAAADAEAAAAFYRELLGWKIEHTMTPAGPYLVAWVAGAETAGMTDQPLAARPAGGSPAWTPYFRAGSLESAIDTVADMGGTVTMPATDVPGETRIAMVADPTGAVFGLLEGPVDRGLHIRTDPGALCWVEVLTRDVSTTGEFYETVFGWRPSTALLGDTTYTTFKLGKRHVAGMLPVPDMVPEAAPSHWLPYFAVADAETAATAAAQLGARVAVPPTTVGPGTYAVIEDPHGAMLAVFEAR